jgi:hypothetical protein
MAADLRLERSASGLTIRFPRPVGLSAKNQDGAEYEGSNPRKSTPLQWRASCLALRLPVSMRRIVACAGLRARVFGWFESGIPTLVYLSAPGLAPEARPIKTRSYWLGDNIPRTTDATTTGYNSRSRRTYRVVFGLQ